MNELAMFPLGTVLLPGAMLPLHIFEPRYRELVRRCVVGDIEPEFGVVLIERGSEVGGGDLRSMAATVARVVQVGETPDGRYALMCVGTHRIRVVEWLPDAPYPRALIEDWPDESLDDDIEPALERCRRSLRRVYALASELGESPPELPAEWSSDPTAASFELAVLSPIGPADQFEVLRALNAADRLQVLERRLGEVEDMVRFRLSAGSSSPDGHDG